MKHIPVIAFVLALLVSHVLLAGGFAVSQSGLNQYVATVSGGQIVAADQLRTYILIQNLGNQTVLASFGSPVSGSVGVNIPAGTSYEPIKGFVDAVYVKSVSGSQNVLVLQGR